MTTEEIKVDDRPMFDSYNGDSFEFVRFIKPDKILVWEDKMDTFSGNSVHEQICRGLNVREVEIEVLKTLKIWKKLSEEIQEGVEKRNFEIKNAVSIRMAKARQGRRQKYPHIPREMVCIKCTSVVKIVPSALAKKIEEKGMLLDDYIKDFHCQKCRPSPRGRKKNPEYEGLPTELICKCGKIVKTSPYQLVEKAEKNKITVEKLIKNFACQKCNPTRGRKKRKKK